MFSSHVYSIHPAFNYLAAQGAHASWKTNRGSFVFKNALMIQRFGDKSLMDAGNVRARMQLVDSSGTSVWVAAPFLLLLSTLFARTFDLYRFFWFGAFCRPFCYVSLRVAWFLSLSGLLKTWSTWCRSSFLLQTSRTPWVVVSPRGLETRICSGVPSGGSAAQNRYLRWFWRKTWRRAFVR